MRIISWNVNGIRAIEKKGFLDWFQKESPDILCLQETKAHPEQLSDTLLKASNYSVKFASSSSKKGYSGVATYSKQELQALYGIGVSRFDNEGRILISKISEQVYLFNVYFPNGKASKERLQYKLDFYNEILDFMKKLLFQGIQIIVCGDVNTAHKEIDLARPKANEQNSGFLPIERAWIDKLLKTGFSDTLRIFNASPDQYSWWDYKTRARDRNIGWRIDYFFISDGLKDNIKSAFILKDVLGSDHCPIGIEIEL